MLQAIDTRQIPLPILDPRVARAEARPLPTAGRAGLESAPRQSASPPVDAQPGASVFSKEPIGESTRRALLASNLRLGAGTAEGAALAGRTGQTEAEEETRPDGLTDAERELIDQLSARDREVREHEEAHARVGGRYAGEPSYTYQLGPDGARYAIGGSVPIDVAVVKGDPEATIAKMAVVKAAALAPAEPSSADRRIAALADAQSRTASAELAAERIARVAEAAGGAAQTPEDAVATGLPAALAALAPDGAGRQLSTRV